MNLDIGLFQCEIEAVEMEECLKHLKLALNRAGKSHSSNGY